MKLNINFSFGDPLPKIQVIHILRNSKNEISEVLDFKKDFNLNFDIVKLIFILITIIDILLISFELKITFANFLLLIIVVTIIDFILCKFY